jgi:hypothetical protein
MALSPDVIFELFLPAEPSTDQKAEIVGFVQGGLPVPVQQPVTVWNPDHNVLTIGFWIVTDGFTEDQLQASLRASSFISGTGSMTAGLFFSTALIRGAAAQGWPPQTPPAHITFDNNINLEVSSAGIVTTVRGAYHPPILPSVGFTYTINDSLTLNQSPPPALHYNESTRLQLSFWDVLANDAILGLLEPFLPGVFWVTFAVGLFGGELFDPHAQGPGATLANAWPSTVLTPISPPLSGKVIFTWGKLNVDDSGIRTIGTWNLAVRSPQVQIVGPRSLQLKASAGSVTGGYTFNANSDLNQVASVVWGGDANGTAYHTVVNFGAGGDYSIQVSVTDVDNVTATAATNVRVTETRNGGHPA